MQRALSLVLDGHADVVDATGVLIRSEQVTLEAPAIIRVHRNIHVRRNGALLSRRRVLARDNHRCAYCGQHADTVDHVHPVSRGGENVWTNVVAACRACNCKKADRTPEDAGMPLNRRPVEPRGVGALRLGVRIEHPSWEEWLSAS